MRARRVVASALLLLVVAAGCAADPPAGDGDPGSTGSTGTPTPGPSEAGSTQPLERSEVAAPDVAATCAAVYEESGDGPGGGTLEERVRVMLASYPFELNEDQARAYTDVDAELTQVIEGAPTPMAEQLSVVRRPFADVTESVRDGGGALVVDTDGVESALDVVEALCADGGFEA